MSSVLLLMAAALTFGEYVEGVRSAVKTRLAETLASAAQAASVSGTVTWAGEDFFFLQRGREGIKITSTEKPFPGMNLVVEGAPALEGGRIVVAARKLQKFGRSPLPAASAIKLSDLLSSAIPHGGMNWRRVAVAGRAIGKTERGIAISVEEVPITVECGELPPELADCADTHPKLVVRGVLELVLEAYSFCGDREEIVGVRLYAEPGGISIAPDLAYMLRRRDGFLRKIMMWILPVLLLGLLGTVVAVIRQRRRLLLSRTIMAERKRMADDIHDTIEQHLVGAKMLIQLGRTQQASDVLVRAKSEIRDIVWGLKNDDMMRISPAEMLRQLAHAENTKGLCRVDVNLERGLPMRLDASKMRDLSLIVRETIGNAVKHGGAKHIAISSDSLPEGGWRLRVANDGEQFDPAKVPGAAEGHFGLEGMRERARRIGGRLSIAPRKGGMVVILEVMK